MAVYNKMLYTVERGIARITLNRPDKRNALDGEIVTEITEALREAEVDEDAGVVLLSGAGKDFCAGADLAALERIADAGAMENLADARRLSELFVAMRKHPRPIIAAVRGRALAGGCGLATAADIVLAAETARFGYPEVNIGFVPAMVMAILRRSVPEKRAFELITSGEVITAAAACEVGLINRVYSDDSFDDEVETYATKLASRSRSALILIKSLLYHMDGLSFEAAIESGAYLNVVARMTEDCKKGAESFLKKD
jgi:methylglutaconyl-CoA hydratase